ncbi:MAG: NADH-quinone oxidoreductase subunit J [Trueperaceae bacterium]
MATFVVLAVVMVVGALGVVLLKQPVHAALSLVGTLLTLAVTYVTLEAHFLAAVQVIVYAGAIMVLFLFVLMLLNVQDTGPRRSLPGLRWAAYAAAVVTATAIAAVAFWDGRPAPDPAVVSLHLQGGSAGGIGDALFGELLLAFHLVGVLLLTGVVGAVALVQRRAESAHGAPKGTGLPAGRDAADGKARALASGGRR